MEILIRKMSFVHKKKIIKAEKMETRVELLN